MLHRSDFVISTLGECTIPSPITDQTFVSDAETVSYFTDVAQIKSYIDRGEDVPAFEHAGPRQMIYHNPAWCRAAILTAGGLCPGLNEVIKFLTLSLYRDYGVHDIYGIRYGYRGLNPARNLAPVRLTPEVVDDIHDKGGSILGSSRGAEDTGLIVDSLKRLGVNLLFCIGGDGTLRAAHDLAMAALKRDLNICVIGIPKTIDNDICYIDKTFGFETAVYATNPMITVAHNEAKGAPNGVGLIHVMGRDSGFIAAYSSLANPHINYCLVPEVKFTLEGEPDSFFPILHDRLKRRHHAVIIVAEGAGQELMKGERQVDKSGNLLNNNIGVFIREKMKEYFKKQNFEINIKYFDPTYLIRGIPANGTDAVFCLLLAQNAVHAAMAGKTDLLIGHWSDVFTHVPIEMATKQRKKIDPNGSLWRCVQMNIR